MNRQKLLSCPRVRLFWLKNVWVSAKDSLKLPRFEVKKSNIALLFLYCFHWWAHVNNAYLVQTHKKLRWVDLLLCTMVYITAYEDVCQSILLPPWAMSIKLFDTSIKFKVTTVALLCYYKFRFFFCCSIVSERTGTHCLVFIVTTYFCIVMLVIVHYKYLLVVYNIKYNSDQWEKCTKNRHFLFKRTVNIITKKHYNRNLIFLSKNSSYCIA